MSISLQKKTYEGATNPFWRGDCKVLPGGYTLYNAVSVEDAQKVNIGTIIPAGTFVQVMPGTLTCFICKTATVENGGTDTEIRVKKGHLFVVGDKIGAESVASTTATITAIDTTNSSYDVLSVDTALTSQSNDVLYEITNVGACVPDAVVCADYKVPPSGIITLDLAYDALVMVDYLKTPILGVWFGDGTEVTNTHYALKGNNSIKIIKQ